MALESRFFQTSFSATLLRRAALAIALIAHVSLAVAETVTLICQTESPNAVTPSSFTLRVDYDRKTVELLRSDGAAQYSAPASVTDAAVRWEVAVPNTDGNRFEGVLNRLSGHGVVNFPRALGANREQFMATGMSGPCRRATQKF